MKNWLAIAGLTACAVWTASAQNTFEITGTPIPAQLLNQNYGNVVKGINGYDLNICNISQAKQSLTSSKIYQALMQADATIQPVGRQIMLASILRNQNRSVANWLSLGLNSATSALSILTSMRGPTTWSATAAMGSLVGQQVLGTLKPALTSDQVEKFENQVLESALVMDAGTCVERTVFTINVAKTKPQGLSFRVR